MASEHAWIGLFIVTTLLAFVFENRIGTTGLDRSEAAKRRERLAPLKSLADLYLFGFLAFGLLYILLAPGVGPFEMITLSYWAAIAYVIRKELGPERSWDRPWWRF